MLKLCPDPVRPPEGNGVVNAETLEEGVEPNNDAAPLTTGVEAERDPKSDDWGEAPDDPNKDTGAEVVGVENREEDKVVPDGVPKRERPLPDEADEIAADVSGAVNAPGTAELENAPAT